MGKSGVVQAMEMKENQRLAVSDKMQAEEFRQRVKDAREVAKQRGLEKATLKMRVWHTVRCSHAALEAELNRIEGEGWTLVNILTNGPDRATIVSARTVEMDLPDEETPEGEGVEKPAVMEEDEVERLRKAFEEETGGAAPETATSTEEIGGDASGTGAAGATEEGGDSEGAGGLDTVA